MRPDVESNASLHFVEATVSKTHSDISTVRQKKEGRFG